MKRIRQGLVARCLFLLGCWFASLGFASELPARAVAVSLEATSTHRDVAADEPLETMDPLAVTPAMRAFVEQRVPRGLSRLARLLELQHAIFDAEAGLGITYGSSRTHTAAETFDSASGNCLSFTLLFVALAQELDLNAYFVEVAEVTGWSQRGNVGLSHWHMYVEVEVDNGVEHIDFLPWTERRYFSARRISRDRARAHFFSNLGAEALGSIPADMNGRASSAKRAAPKLALAFQHFNRALEYDPSFTPARINRSVAYRRLGEAERAVEELLEVLEKEPRNDVAATNLASALLTLDRRDEAQQWLTRRARFLEQNPFHHFRLGLAALQTENAELAREYFKRAIERQQTESLFHEHLATSYERLGQKRKARASLRQALRFSDDPDSQLRIEQRLNGGEEPPP